jgi:hypothetical protein
MILYTMASKGDCFGIGQMRYKEVSEKNPSFPERLA